MLSVVLLGAVAALRAPGRGRPAGSLPKKPLRGGRDTAELFVANLPDDSDRNEFLNFARSAFPAVRRVTVPRDRSTGAARGFVATRARFCRFNGLSRRCGARPTRRRATESGHCLSQAFVEVPRDDVPAAVKAFDGVLLGSKRLKARPADKRAAVAPDRSDRSSYAVNQRLAACATGLDVARECAAQTKGGAPLSGVNVATALQRIAKLEARRTKRDERVDKAFHVLAKEAARQAQDGAPRELANILWALAKFKLTTAWAFARPVVQLDRRRVAGFDAIAKAAHGEFKRPGRVEHGLGLGDGWGYLKPGGLGRARGPRALEDRLGLRDRRALSLTAPGPSPNSIATLAWSFAREKGRRRATANCSSTTPSHEAEALRRRINGGAPWPSRQDHASSTPRARWKRRRRSSRRSSRRTASGSFSPRRR